MSGKTAKKIRRQVKRNYKDVVREVLKLPFYQRLQWAWFVVTHHIKEESDGKKIV